MNEGQHHTSVHFVPLTNSYNARFFEIDKVGNIGSFVMLKFDNKLKIVISDISFAIRMYLVRNYFQFTYIRSYMVLNIGWVSNETNEDVRMYIEEFILVEIWIHWSRVWN